MEDIKKGRIVPVDANNIKALISVAANYDEELVDILYEAFKPTEDNGSIAVGFHLYKSQGSS